MSRSSLEPVRLTGALSLRKVHGSLVGRLPGYAYRMRFAPGHESALFDLYDSVCEASFVDGSAVQLPNAPNPARAIEKRLRERRPSWARLGVTSVAVIFGPRMGSADPAFCRATAFGPNRRNRLTLVETATLREVARLGYKWPAHLSPCGRLAAYAQPRRDEVTVVELDRRTSRRVPAPWRTEHGPRRQLVIDGASDTLVVAYRVLGNDPSQLVCLDLASGARRWEAVTRGAPVHVGPLVDAPARVVWTHGGGRLEARSVADGALVRSLPCEDNEHLHFDDGDRYAASVRFAEHSFVRIDLRTGERVDHSDGPGGAVYAVACSNSGRSFARVFESGLARVNSLATGATEHDLDLGLEYGCLDPTALAFEAGDASLLAVTEVDIDRSEQRCLRVPLSSGVPDERSFALPAPIEELVPAPDGSCTWVVTAPIEGVGPRTRAALLLSADLQRVLVQSERVGDYDNHPLAVGFCVDPADGRLLAVLGDAEQCFVETYDAVTGAYRDGRSLRPPWMPAVVPNGSMRLSADGTRVFFEGYDEGADESVRALLCTPTLGQNPGPWRAFAWGTGTLRGTRRMGNEVALEMSYDGLRVHALYDWRTLGSCLIEPKQGHIAAAALSPDERTIFVALSSGLVLECELDR